MYKIINSAKYYNNCVSLISLLKKNKNFSFFLSSEECSGSRGKSHPNDTVPEFSVILQLDHRDTYGIRKPNYSYTSWRNYKDISFQT